MYCGLSGHLVPACPLRHIFITEDIRIIAHTDPNPAISCHDETYDGEIIIPDTPPPFIPFLQHDTDSVEISLDNTPSEDLPPTEQNSDASTVVILKSTFKSFTSKFF
eukprot:TRINITY_DN307_c0_g1_i6.p1 TRINITY_DN307_c0_g1~~TRINITY_DN307_c0_g1_i6.p1  ORF type:complete len:107 (-),score=15.00 TRINITY_DN307_c0_g1_i6:684-1004(-)